MKTAFHAIKMPFKWVKVGNHTVDGHRSMSGGNEMEYGDGERDFKGKCIEKKRLFFCFLTIT